MNLGLGKCALFGGGGGDERWGICGDAMMVLA